MNNHQHGNIDQFDAGHFNRDLGIEMEEWRDGYVRLRLNVEQRHCNRSNFLHGGVIATLLDAALGYAGTWCSVPGNVRRGVTLSLNTQFMAAGEQGLVFTEATHVGGGRSIFFAEGTVKDEEGKLLATGTATYKLSKDSQNIEGSPA